MNYHINTKKAGHLEQRDSINHLVLQEMKAYVMLSHYINIYNLIVNIMQNQYDNNKNRCIIIIVVLLWPIL